MLPLEDRELLNQTMVGLNIDPDTIASLMESFDAAASGLEEDPIQPVPGTSFGESYTGGYRLGTNVEMAHQAVADELDKMIAGLREMASSVEAFSQDVQRTTEQTQATMVRIQQATDCVAAPTFDGGSCSLPTGEEG
jgi:hypothetical protein